MNGAVTYLDTTYQSEAVFGCDEGFTLSSTAPRVCQADSTWSNSDPTCIINGKIRVCHYTLYYRACSAIESSNKVECLLTKMAYYADNKGADM